MSAIDRRRSVRRNFRCSQCGLSGTRFLCEPLMCCFRKQHLKVVEKALPRSLSRIWDWWWCVETMAPVRAGEEIHDQRKYQIARDTLRCGIQLLFFASNFLSPKHLPDWDFRLENRGCCHHRRLRSRRQWFPMAIFGYWVTALWQSNIKWLASKLSWSFAGSRDNDVTRWTNALVCHPGGQISHKTWRL